MKRILMLALMLVFAFSASAAVNLPAGGKQFTDVAYGSDPLQKLDVYVPANVVRAPVIFMVHGGGWVEGDKANHNVVFNKVPYFLGKGFVLVSTNYRLSPAVNPV